MQPSLEAVESEFKAALCASQGTGNSPFLTFHRVFEKASFHVALGGLELTM